MTKGIDTMSVDAYDNFVTIAKDTSADVNCIHITHNMDAPPIACMGYRDEKGVHDWLNGQKKKQLAIVLKAEPPFPFHRLSGENCALFSDYD
jgi:hypothetical protein